MNIKSPMSISIKPINELDTFIEGVTTAFPHYSGLWTLSIECYLEVLNDLYFSLTHNFSYQRQTMFYEFLYTFNQALIESEPLRFEAGEGNIILIDHELDREIYYCEESNPPFYSTVK